mmetsp:Transcript_22544/g.42491  ORF Transcript_22544/g.42491 Transcript_22544/m.42491 type:complete len:269 (+) Transcript_22544:52-858(+)
MARRAKINAFFTCFVAIATSTDALEARSPSLMQMTAGRAPDAAFFSDSEARPHSSAAQDSISEAVAHGHRRANLADVEAVDQQHPAKRDRVAARTPTLLQTPEASEPAKREERKSNSFTLLKLDGLKLDGLKEASGRVMSLVAAGARAAAESAAPTLLKDSHVAETPAAKASPPKRRSPSALAALGLKRAGKSLPAAPLAALQRTADSSEVVHNSVQIPQRLQAKSAAYDEAKEASEEQKRKQEDDTRDKRLKMEDLMDEVRTAARPW